MTAETVLPAGGEPVAWACAADIAILTDEGADVSLCKVARPEYGMKMPLYATPPHLPSGETIGGGELVSERMVQALHAGISRRDWHAIEIAANAIRDAVIR